jgi:hypothetical protein
MGGKLPSIGELMATIRQRTASARFWKSKNSRSIHLRTDARPDALLCSALT